MCLEIIAQISPHSKTRVSARRLSEITGLHVSSVHHSGHSALHFSVNGGCSCDFLSDDADWNSPLWSLADEHLAAFAKAVNLLGEETDGFTLLVHWLGGERVRDSQKIRVGQLIRYIKANQVQNNVLYLVGKQSSPGE
jgi:hypothetical protein